VGSNDEKVRETFAAPNAGNGIKTSSDTLLEMVKISRKLARS
jgi:hypothetical protein